MNLNGETVRKIHPRWKHANVQRHGLRVVFGTLNLAVEFEGPSDEDLEGMAFERLARVHKTHEACK